jgi:K+-transporting ATPase ATPase C chain
MSHIRPAFVLLLLLSLLTGLAYPLAITGIAQNVMPWRANGSLVMHEGQVIGSELIGQNFVDPKYFHGRLSATTDTDPNDATKTISVPYNAASSSGSNLGPTSKALLDRITTDVQALKEEGSGPVPVGLVTSSASGLDPHIAPTDAYFQVARIAKARNIQPERISNLIARYTEPRFLGLLGEPVINVLALNRALDSQGPDKALN